MTSQRHNDRIAKRNHLKYYFSMLAMNQFCYAWIIGEGQRGVDKSSGKHTLDPNPPLAPFAPDQPVNKHDKDRHLMMRSTKCNNSHRLFVSENMHITEGVMKSK